MKKRKLLSVAVVIVLLAALSSCAGTARKKRYRFGGCEIAQVEADRTASSHAAANA